jgi:SAM-dependent methyltransferase
MKCLAKSLHRLFSQFGLDLRKLIYSVISIPGFIADIFSYNKKLKASQYGLKISHFYPILHEKHIPSGEASGHYFHQDIWAARKIYKSNPERHIDVASSVTGFISSLLVFRKVEVVDIRPNTSTIEGLSFIQSDATNLKEFEDSSVESISSLHAGEHFGLGRYGDPIDPDAHIKFMKSLTRVLKPGGRLYYAIPSGREKVYFNAHRVLSPHTVVSGFEGLRLLSFSCVKDDGNLYENCDLETVSQETYGCGLYEFTKD